MLLANYGSDSESESEAGPSRPIPPPPAASAKKAKRKGPVKITLDLPKPEADDANGRAASPKRAGSAEVEEEKPVKKAKLGGAGSSLLLGMLPPPKRKLPTKASSGSTLAVNKSMARTASPAAIGPSAAKDDDDDDGPALLVPAAVKKKARQEEELDLFGLAEAAPKPKPSLPISAAKPGSVTSAPPVAEFVPPEPRVDDPYPGYYQLPSGSWAAYDPKYYASFFQQPSDSLSNEKDQKVDRLGRWSELDDGRANVVEVDVSAGVKAAREEAERLARLSKPKLPGDEFEYNPIGQTGGLASERHQLSSLLSSAYSQREELEARIAENKRNSNMARQKYGF